MADLRITNVRPWGGEPADLVVTDGVLTDVAPRVPAGTGSPAEAAEPGSSAVLDGGGLLALPGFVNAHAHVDKSWWGAPWVSWGGEATTQGRIAHERAERDALGIPGHDSTVAVLRELLRHGTTAVRTHVDVDLGVGLRGIETVRAAAAELDGALALELVAFPQDGVLRRPGVLDLLRAAARAGVDHVGGIDPASIDRDPVAQVEALVDLAATEGVGIDLHLHDPGELGAFQCELLADRVRRAGLGGRVTVSHGFALGDVGPLGPGSVGAARQEALLDDLAAAGIAWTTVAPVRTVPLPWRQMVERGIALGLGTDGIRDLWSPYGDGDLLRVALGFARLHGLRTDDDLVAAVRLATSGGAAFVGRPQHDLVVGAPGDVVLLDAENVADALVRAPVRRHVVARGRVVVRDGEPTV
ncbi:amidohydrolase family protein [Nocardioides zeae]|uniref:Amidohydrolase family protein n=1 Tax=Nocardioides imazamoxiresistens TaxID=3231893 RepID=A0ABU3Q0Z6_9ACTN|nr:amidohydrolase family protein [Nocardioides zeae]MDT9595178.1 amidohydrolase family protein [Nocardioides zeae]